MPRNPDLSKSRVAPADRINELLLSSRAAAIPLSHTRGWPRRFMLRPAPPDVPDMPGLPKFPVDPVDRIDGSPATRSLRGPPRRGWAAAFPGNILCRHTSPDVKLEHEEAAAAASCPPGGFGGGRVSRD